MEFRNLYSFLRVVELGSFTKAAQELGYAQSTITTQIKQLEAEMGCWTPCLFDCLRPAGHSLCQPNPSDSGADILHQSDSAF